MIYSCSYLNSILLLTSAITLFYLFIFLGAKIFWHSDVSKPFIRLRTVKMTNTWNSFVALETYTPTSVNNNPNHLSSQVLSACNSSIVKPLSQPKLTREEYDWCLWAVDPLGGNVTPKTFWGTLKNKPDLKFKFQSLRCDKLHARHESCNDIEGDEHIRNWMKQRVFEKELQCAPSKTSKQYCYQNNSELFCELENVLIDFSKYRDTSRINRFGEVLNIRDFESDFLSTDCKDTNDLPDSLPYSHAYSTKLPSSQCDIIHPGTVLLYSHDYLENFGHTVNDMMNVWRIMWLTGLASSMKQIDFLNVDGIYGSRVYNDEPNAFFRFYKDNFRHILLGHAFNNKTMCIRRLLLPPLPNRFFLFDLWHGDDKCGFVGPSSLFQRYNFHVRGLYNNGNKNSVSVNHNNNKDDFTIVVIVRNEVNNLNGTSSKTSRKYLNIKEIKDGLSSSLRPIAATLNIKHLNIIYQDFNVISYEEQLQLISKTNILVGMHGAGIPQSMHMSIGTLPHCCGVIEIFPSGSFTVIRAHGNMIRRMGLRYDRIDVNVNDSKSDGAIVSLSQLATATNSMMQRLYVEPTCVLPVVIGDGTSNPMDIVL